ncbi:MAG: hypothetical protein J6M30_08640 [Bacteroidales bacterium]|nr:hypothetical protein [Bacteroidales bacterium]
MKEFAQLIRWKDLTIAFLALIIIRISIIIPFYLQWMLPPDKTWDIFLTESFGLVFLFAANNAAVRFFDEKQRLSDQTKQIVVNIKDYPDLMRLRGVWIVLLAVGVMAAVSSYIMGRRFDYVHIATVVIMALGFHYAYSSRHALITGNLETALMYSVLILSQIPASFGQVDTFDFNNMHASFVTIPQLYRLFFIIALFAFLLALIRDITGDMANIPQDSKHNFKTLAVTLGGNRCKYVLYALAAVFVLFVAAFLYVYVYKLEIVQVLTVTVIVILPTVYYAYLLRKATQPTDYDFLYTLTGMIFISLLFIIFFCKYIFINEYF